MKKVIAIVLLSAFCALTVGCGVKGSLYFPEKVNQTNS